MMKTPKEILVGMQARNSERISRETSSTILLEMSRITLE